MTRQLVTFFGLVLLLGGCLQQNSSGIAETSTDTPVETDSDGTDSNEKGGTDDEEETDDALSTDEDDTSTENDTATGNDTVDSETAELCPSGCTIGDECISQGTVHPDNPCLHCDTVLSQTDWSNADGAPCDDGIFCNGDDVCQNGTCSEHLDPPCGDDAVCDEDQSICCLLNRYQECNDDGNRVWVDSCGHHGDIAEECAAQNSICTDAGCQCERGWIGDDCDVCIVYVNNNLASYQDADGKSWNAAFENLQDGLDAAVAESCEVWVASGTYKPTRTLSGSASDAVFRRWTFAVHPGQAVYGGFAGTESSRDARLPAVNVTILSGSIGLGISEYSYHVVTAGDGSLLDGLTVRSGAAHGGDGTGDDLRGGGIFVPEGDLTVRQCVVKHNLADAGGSAIYLRDGHLWLEASQVTENYTSTQTASNGQGSICIDNGEASIVNTAIKDNSASFGAALVLINASRAVVVNSVMLGNRASNSGGAIFSGNGGTVRLANTVLQENEAAKGGALYVLRTNVDLENTTFYRNSTDTGGALVINRSSVDATNSIFWNTTATDGPIFERYETGTEYYSHCLSSTYIASNISTNMVYDNPRLTAESGGVVRLQCPSVTIDCSPAVNAGNSNDIPADYLDINGDGNTDDPISVDLFNNPRESGNTVDIGAEEFQL